VSAAADTIRIAPRFGLDADYVGGGTLAFLAKKGAGKTYAGRVLAEEFWRVKVPFAVLDPMGAFWGLRSNAAGDGPGIPVAIFGGRHGDIPLERGAGALMADLLIEQRLSMVLDLKGLGSRAAERQFARDFLERLYARNEDLVHLIIDEADLFAPQKPQPGDAPLLGVTENIVRRGRNVGIGCTLMTQRPAVLNKDVLTQIDALVAGRITGYQDREAIDDWVRGHGDQEIAREVKGTLAQLATGESWWWVPELDVLKRITVREAKTFDSSPTRKRRDAQTEPKTFADVDLGGLQQRMTATIERAAAEDPKLLRQRIAELERELAARPDTPPERVEVPVLPDNAIEALSRASTMVSGDVESAAVALGELRTAAAEIEALVELLVDQLHTEFSPAPSPAPAPARRPPAAPAPAPAAATAEAGPSNGEVQLGRAARVLLGTLISHLPRRLTRAELSTLSGYKGRSSTYRNALSALRVNGLLEEDGSTFTATAAGIELIGAAAPAAPQTTEQLLNTWYQALGRASREMLGALVAVYPGELTREELEERTGYSLTSSTFRNGLSALRVNGLLAEPNGQLAASDSLFIG
jgi:hypothetical protein